MGSFLEFIIQLVVIVSVYGLVDWRIQAWRLKKEEKLQLEIIKALQEHKKSFDDYKKIKTLERWNIKMLRQEVIELVKAKGGKL